MNNKEYLAIFSEEAIEAMRQMLSSCYSNTLIKKSEILFTSQDSGFTFIEYLDRNILISDWETFFNDTAIALNESGEWTLEDWEEIENDDFSYRLLKNGHYLVRVSTDIYRDDTYQEK